MASNPRVKAGFSLIEIMIATLLMGLMGGLMMTSINSSVNAKDTVEEISGRYQVARQAMSRMAREISMAYLSKNIKLEEPSAVTQFKGRQDKLFFSAFGNVIRQKDAHQSDQQVIGFYLGQDKLGQRSLMRRQQANLNNDVERGGRAQVLCPNVKELKFSYFDSQMDKWEESWLSDPIGLSALENNNKGQKIESGNLPKPWRLPAFVKISMTLDMGRDVEMTWVSQAQIPIQEPLDLN